MKPNSYTQIYIQYVFAVKHREGLIQPHYQEEVFSFISGLVDSMGHKCFAVNGMHDHVHVFLSFNPKLAPSETIKEKKELRVTSLMKRNGFQASFSGNRATEAFLMENLRLMLLLIMSRNKRSIIKRQLFVKSICLF